MGIIISLVIFLLVINFLVFVHELGHFMAAKATGVKVNEFGLGFGKQLAYKNFKGTKYVFRAIPLGGYVQLEGEQSSEGIGSFRNKPYLSKLLVLSGGVLMNILVAIIFFAFALQVTNYKFLIPKFDGEFKFSNVSSQQAYFPVSVASIDDSSSLKQDFEVGDTIIKIEGTQFDSIENFYSNFDTYSNREVELELIDLETFEVSKKTVLLNTLNSDGLYPVEIGEFLPDSPLQGQFRTGDKLVGFDDNFFTSTKDFFERLPELRGREVNVNYIDTEGNGKAKIIFIPDRGEQPVLGIRPMTYDGGLGFSFDNETGRQTYFLSYDESIIKSSVSLTYDLFRYQFVVLSQIVSDAIDNGDYDELSKTVSGPAMIGQRINEVVEFQAFTFLLPLIAIISLSLATFNILPFPALDGGQISVATIESISRKRIPDKILNIINASGFAFLILLAIVINVKDVVQLGWVEQVWQNVKVILGK